MKNIYANVAGSGVDAHYEFSKVALVDGRGRVVRRERLEHRDRAAKNFRLNTYRAYTPARGPWPRILSFAQKGTSKSPGLLLTICDLLGYKYRSPRVRVRVCVAADMGP